jgi:hypothetical protein
MVGDGMAETPAADEIVVTSQPTPKVDLTGGLSTIPASALLSQPAPAPSTPPPPKPPEEPPAEDEIVVTNRPTPKVDLTGGLSAIVPSVLPPVGPPSPPPPPKPPADDKPKDKDKDTLDKIADVAEIAGLVIPAVGALVGGGGGGAGTGTYTSGRGALNPLFSAKLPTPGTAGAFTVGGLGPATGPNPLAARSAADYYRYAMGPAMDMPAGVNLSAATSPYAGFGPGTLGEETFRRITTGMARGGPMGYARGSSRESFAVRGPGDGRSDDIPAMLSDGEYVIDAETVALAGKGSTEAGAKAFDELRVNIRKHKGKNLAKGKFSADTKPLVEYMRGGRI